MYSGNEDTLPKIFDRINSKGTALIKYEVYTGSWPIDKKFKVENDYIIQNILKSIIC